jgi:MFS family permease
MVASSAAAQGPPRWREVFRGQRGRLTAGLLLLEALVAMHALVVATILPDVRRELGMVELYGLVFTAASLATLGAIPIAGRAVDRLGARRVLPPVLALFTIGLVVAASAPAMPVVLVGQFLAGAGGGGLYAMSLGTVAKTYPDRLRPRVLALLASMWILPGVVGPPLGALLASTVGWRWAFLAPLPIVATGWLLIAPTLSLVTDTADRRTRLDVRWPLQLMVGAGIAFTAMTVVRPWAIVAVVIGAAIALPALTQIVPRGTFRAERGVPASAVAAFTLSLGFLAIDAFLTLMLTEIRGLSIGQAGLAVTGATLTWGVGSWWQSSRAERTSLSRLLIVGAALVLLGGALVASALSTEVPLAAAYGGWAVVGFGMGVAFPTIPLAAMRAAGVGEESTELSSVLLMDMLGVATGAGLGGAAVALADATDRPLTSGIGASFAIGLLAIAALLVLARRIDAGTTPES